MATFLAANLGELPDHRPIENTMELAQQPVFTVNPHFKQGLAWQDISAVALPSSIKTVGCQALLPT
jgi:hypothetical protein